MATADAERLFLDTNVLVYATVESAPWHHPIRARLERLLREERELVVSTQILREFVAVLSRPQSFAKPAPIRSVLMRADGWRSCCTVLGETPATFERLCALLRRFPIAGKRVHDANVVACMLEAGIRHLLTCNTEDFRAFDGEIACIDPRASGTAP